MADPLRPSDLYIRVGHLEDENQRLREALDRAMMRIDELEGAEWRESGLKDLVWPLKIITGYDTIEDLRHIDFSVNNRWRLAVRSGDQVFRDRKAYRRLRWRFARAWAKQAMQALDQGVKGLEW